ncbi:hypothetical protein BGZ58_006714, partial [Dissophora ornata]
MFKRKDIEDRYVEEANRMIKAITVEMNTNLGPGDRIFWSEAPAEVTKELFVDDVHLDEEGYRIWDEALYPRVLELLAEGEV